MYWLLQKKKDPNGNDQYIYEYFTFYSSDDPPCKPSLITARYIARSEAEFKDFYDKNTKLS